MLPHLEAFLKSDQAQAFEGNGFVTIDELLKRIESMRRHERLDAEAYHAGIQKGLADIESTDEFPHDAVAKTDWDWLNETSADALVKMPPHEPTTRLRARWWSLPEHGRLFFSNVFASSHLPEHRDPVGIDNPFYALDLRQPSLIQNPLAGCLASTSTKNKNCTCGSFGYYKR